MEKNSEKLVYQPTDFTISGIEPINRSKNHRTYFSTVQILHRARTRIVYGMLHNANQLCDCGGGMEWNMEWEYAGIT